ncbi:MAG: GNAT family N-acetyltransferase [Rhizobiaceae bacterium]
MDNSANVECSVLPSGITIEILENFETLQAYRDEWLDLESRSQDSFTYFQTYDWCEQWCRFYISDNNDLKQKSLFIVAVKNGDKLASIWPLVIERRSRIVKVLRFLGEPLIQYGNILVDQNLLSVSALDLCWQKIKCQAKCDAIVLDRFVSDTPLSRLFGENDRFNSEDVETSLIDVLKYPDAESFVASQSRSSRKSRNRKRRKLEALGETKFEVIKGKSPGFTDLINLAMQMKIGWLVNSGRSTASMRDIRTLQLLTALQSGSAHASGVVAMSYSVDGKPVAIEIGFCHKLHYYSFIGAFDWEMRSYSPGKLQLEQAVLWAIENGFETYDFLGNPSEYKDTWTNHHMPIFGHATGKTALGFIYANYWKPQIRPAIKNMFSRMPVPIRQKIVGISQFVTNRSTAP